MKHATPMINQLLGIRAWEFRMFQCMCPQLIHPNYWGFIRCGFLH